MARGKRGSKMFGTILIFIGVMWLLKEMGFRDVLRGELGMWAMAIFGMLMFLTGYKQKRRGLVFWGSFLSLSQPLQLLRYYMSNLLSLYQLR